MNINDLRACCQAVVNGEPDAEVRLCECVFQLDLDEYPLKDVSLPTLTPIDTEISTVAFAVGVMDDGDQANP